MEIFFKWSIGYAAKNIEAESSALEVVCPELSPMIQDTDIDTVFSSIPIEAIKSIGGGDVSGDMEVADSVVAEYIGRSNMSIPDINKGEMVEIAGIVGGKFFWKEIGYNDNYRAVEDLIIHVANKDTSVVDLTELNTYRLRLNSKDKYISITTSKLDPDKVVYTFKLDVNGTNAILMDDVGNHIKIDSLVPNIQLSNKSGSLLELNDKNININAPEDITITAGRQITIKSPAQSVNVDTTVITGKELSVTASASTVIVAPKVGINGVLGVTGGVAAAMVTGTALSIGPPPPPAVPAKIVPATGSATGSSGGVSSPSESPGNDHASSFEKLSIILTGLLSCIQTLSSAIDADNSAHTGITTAPSPAVPALLATISSQISSLTSAIPHVIMPKVSGPAS